MYADHVLLLRTHNSRSVHLLKSSHYLLLFGLILSSKCFVVGS